MLQVTELFIYPIKSLAGISVKEARVTNMGFEYDRRWMLVDEYNLFITQRTVPQMALMKVAIEKDGLTVTYHAEELFIPFNASTNSRELFTIWDDTCTGEYVSKEADAWFSAMLDMNCRLVHMPDDTRRLVEQNYAPENSIMSFADAYPFLMIGQASLDELNSRLTEALPMNRFRPNIVFSGGQPFEEDLIGEFIINGINFQGAKLCARCPIPTINQDTATRGKEPLKTLASYRQKNNKIYFGQNLIHEGNGIISVGDQLLVKSFNHEDRFMINEPAGKY
ncbi:MAG TPA: MOSC N-terminal beta barrel domain-containing protein [Mucilaginibacter sp.]